MKIWALGTFFISAAALVACGGSGGGNGGGGAGGGGTTNSSSSSSGSSNSSSGSSSSSSGSSSSGSSSSSSGSVSCDGKNDCMACQNCAYAGPCSGQYNACASDQDCVALVMCIAGCNKEQACVDGCVQQHQGGVALYSAAADCVLCDTCPMDCEIDVANDCGG